MHPCINFSPISFQAKILRKTLLSCSFWVPEIHLTSISASKEVKRRRYVIVKVISWSTLMHKCLAFINLQTEALFEPIISQINWCFHKKIRLRYSRRFRKSPKTSTGETSNVTSSTATSTENVVGDEKAPSGGRKRKQNVLVHNQVYFILRCFLA